MSQLSFPSDFGGLLSLPPNTESGTSAPFISAFAPQSPVTPPPAPSTASIGLGALTGAGTGVAASFAQYTALALLAVVLVGIGTFVLLKD